jgi:hypothetical protein
MCDSRLAPEAHTSKILEPSVIGRLHSPVNRGSLGTLANCAEHAQDFGTYLDCEIQQGNWESSLSLAQRKRAPVVLCLRPVGKANACRWGLKPFVIPTEGYSQEGLTTVGARSKIVQNAEHLHSTTLRGL